MRPRPFALASVIATIAVLAVHIPPATAVDSSPCPSPASTASGARTCVNQSTSPYDELEKRLGGDIAKGLATQQKLTEAVNEAAAYVQLLTAQLTTEEGRVAALQDQVAQLDQEIADLASRIDVERQQVAALAVAMYRQPASFLDIIASSGNLGQALSAAADLVVAGQRAHALQARLQADLVRVQADRDARQSALDQETAVLAQVQSGLDQMSGAQGTLSDLMSQLSDLIGQLMSAVADVRNQPTSVTDALAQLLEQEEQALVQQSEATAWAQANVGAGLAMDAGELPAGSGPSGLALSWPLVRGTITQGFGPTSFVLEPPLGAYSHFHTGIDVSAALAAPVHAAGDGVVVAVAHTNVGYGNYVILAHGSGVLTLYAHLLSTNVTPGELVVRSEVIGLEGSSGFSTGPHVHFEVRVNNQVVDPIRYLPHI